MLIFGCFLLLDNVAILSHEEVLIQAGKGWAGSQKHWPSRCWGCRQVNKAQHLRGAELSSTFWRVLESPVAAGLPLGRGVHGENLGCGALGNTVRGHLTF